MPAPERAGEEVSGMLNGLRRRVTYANVMSTIAVFAVLGGGAWAAEKIGPKDIRKNAVRAKHIKNGHVRTADIRNNSVTLAKHSCKGPGGRMVKVGATCIDQFEASVWDAPTGGNQIERRGREAVVPSLLGVADAPSPQWRHVPGATHEATTGAKGPPYSSATAVAASCFR